MDGGVVLAIAAGLVLLVLASYGAVLYNRLVALKHNVAQAWSNIDVLLKQRHDELPKLVATCKEYMGYEQATLTRVMEARGQVQQARDRGDVPALGAAESGLRMGLGQLFALAEAYPDLKADSQFQHLADRISGLENAIADRREYYNQSVNSNNIRIEQFPDVLVARLFAFHPFDLLRFGQEETGDVDMAALFGGSV